MSPICPSLPFLAPEQGVGVKGAPSPCPQCPQHNLLSSASPCLSRSQALTWLTITRQSADNHTTLPSHPNPFSSTSLAAPGDHLLGTS